MEEGIPRDLREAGEEFKTLPAPSHGGRGTHGGTQQQHLMCSHPVVIDTLPKPYLEKPQDVGHHDGDGAARGTDDADHPLGFGDDGGAAVDAAHLGAVLLNEGLHEGQRLLQGVRVPRARVQDAGAQRDVGEQVGVVVDAVQGEEHGLQAMDALLLLQLPAGFALHTPAMHREEAPERDVPVDADGVHVRVALALGLGGTPGCPPPAPGTQEEAEGETLHAKGTPAHRQRWGRARAQTGSSQGARLARAGGTAPGMAPSVLCSQPHQWLPPVVLDPQEQRAAGLQEGAGFCMATPGQDAVMEAQAQAMLRVLPPEPLGTGMGEQEGERKLSRSMRKASALLSFHQGSQQELAPRVTARKRFGIPLIFDSQQQLWLSPNCIRAEGLVRSPQLTLHQGRWPAWGWREALGPYPIPSPVQGAARVRQAPRECSEEHHMHPQPSSLPAP